MYANKNVRKSKYTYSNRFVIRETLANYQYSDDIISFMLRETKINENMFSIIKYYQTDALSFMQAKTNKVLRYHIYNEIYNVYLFHNDIKGLFKRAKMDRLKQFEVRRVLLLCEYSFVNRYINKEEKLEDQTLDELLELKDANNVRIDNLHMHNELSEKLIMEVKHEIMSFNKNLCIKNQNNTLYYYFENQIIALLRETWDRTLFEVFNRVFDEFCAAKHVRNKDCDKYYRRKLDFIVHSLYLKKINYNDLKHIEKHLKLKKRHKKIIVKKGMNAKEIIRYFERYKDVKVLLYFAERKYNKKVYTLLEIIGTENEITRKVRNAHADKGGIIFSTRGYGINRVDTTKIQKERADSSLAENEEKQSVTSQRKLKAKTYEHAVTLVIGQ